MVRWAVTIAVLALWAAPARADESVARQAMQRGVAAMAAGDAARALPEFERAIAEVPGAPVPHRYAGEALEQLGRWDEAVAAYELYLSLRPDSRDAADVRTRLARIAAEHQRGELSVHCTPAGADIELDGSPAGAAPREGLRVAAGAHTLHVTAVGYLARNLAVNVVGGQRTVVECDLDKLPPAGPRDAPAPTEPVVRRPAEPRPQPEPPRRHGRSWYRRPWVWAAAGAAVVATGVGVYLVLPDRPDTAGGDIHFPP